MGWNDTKVRDLYDRSVQVPLLWDLDAWCGRATENSIYRNKAIAALKLAPDSAVLDAACGTGLNFKLLQRRLGEEGKLVGVDLSSGVLRVAAERVRKHDWTNVELVQASIVDYWPELRFDAVLCTLAMTIIPKYEVALERMLDLLKPEGRFAMIGIRPSDWMPCRLFNPVMGWICRLGRIDWDRDVAGLIRAKCREVAYEECFGGWYYILSTSRSSCVEAG